MKQFNKHILEAINRGINLAIDDFGDIDNDYISSPIHRSGTITDLGSYDVVQLKILHNIIDKINKNASPSNHFYNYICEVMGVSKDMLKQQYQFLTDTEVNVLIDNIEKYNVFDREYVDLDLPSGTLWCTRNLNTDGDNDYEGDKYHWGDVNPINPNDYSSFSKLIPNYYIKALKTNNYAEDFLINKDDAAYNVNKHYKTPTIRQFIELKENTIIYRTGTNGTLLVSKVNPLNFIFFSDSNNLYLTSDIKNYNINISMDKPDPNKPIIYLMKLYKNNRFECFPYPFKAMSNGNIPTANGWIRPVYKIK